MGFLGIIGKNKKKVSKKEKITEKSNEKLPSTSSSATATVTSSTPVTSGTSTGFFSPHLPTFPLTHPTLTAISDHILSHCLTTPLFLFSTKDCSPTSLASTLESLRTPNGALFNSPAQAGIVLRLFFIRFGPLVQWADYCNFRSLEAEAKYPTDAFETLFIPNLNFREEGDKAILETLFNLLSRVTAYATQNGCSPTKLAALFGPLLFGFTGRALDVSQDSFVRLQNAAEHLLLAFIRSQNSSVPRLQAWVAGYPQALSHSLGKPSKDVITKSVKHIRKYVASYSEKLWCDALDWNFSEVSNLSDARPVVAPSFESRMGSTMRSKGSSTNQNFVRETVNGSRSPPIQSPGDWGQFEFEGFGSGSSQNGHPTGQNGLNLSLELGSPSRKARKEEPKIVDWPLFAGSEFEFGASDLNDDLKFDPRILVISETNAKDKKKLRKSEKELQQKYRFNHPIAPQLEGTMMIMEGFIDAYVDLILSAEWIEKPDPLDSSRTNWTFVEIKKSPISSISDASSEWILFEEVIPEEFRASVLKNDRNQLKAGGLFSSWTSSKSSAPASLYNKGASISTATLANSTSRTDSSNDPFEGKATKYVSLSPMSVKSSSASATHLPISKSSLEYAPPLAIPKKKAATFTVKAKEVPPPLPITNIPASALPVEYQMTRHYSASSADAEPWMEIVPTPMSSLPHSPSITRSLRAEMEKNMGNGSPAKIDIQTRPMSMYPDGGIDFSEQHEALVAPVTERVNIRTHGRNLSSTSEITMGETSEDEYKPYSPALQGNIESFYTPMLEGEPILPNAKSSSATSLVRSENSQRDMARLPETRESETDNRRSVTDVETANQEISYQPRDSMESSSTITPSHASTSLPPISTEIAVDQSQSRIAALVNMYSQPASSKPVSPSPPSTSPVGKQPARGITGPKLSSGDIALAMSMAPKPVTSAPLVPVPERSAGVEDTSSPYQHGMPLAVLTESEEELQGV